MAKDRLTINSGEEYTVGEGESQEYYGATVEGKLDLSEQDSQLRLVDNPEDAIYNGGGPQQPGTSPISLPLEIDFSNMDIGNALFITLLTGLLSAIVVTLKNYAAGILLMMATFTLIVSGLLGIGLEAYWAMMAGTVLLLIVGMAYRWSR